MNSEFSPTPREELEAQITALLLGELPEHEAAALREKIAADLELRKLHTEIGVTIGLLKEAIASPQPAEIAAPEGLKLSEEKREKLLATFKVVKAPTPVKEPIRIDFRSWGALAAMIVGLLAVAQWMVANFFVRARTSAQSSRVAIVEGESLSLRDAEWARGEAEFEKKGKTLALISPRQPALTGEEVPGERPAQVIGTPATEAKAKSAPQESRFYRAEGTAPQFATRAAKPDVNNVRIELPQLAAAEENKNGVYSVEAVGLVAQPTSDEVTLSFGGGGGGGGKSMDGAALGNRGFFDAIGTSENAGGIAGVGGRPAAMPSTSVGFGVVPGAPANGPATGNQWHANLEPGQRENLNAFDAPSAGKPVQDFQAIAGDDFNRAQQRVELQIAQREIPRGRSLGREVESQIVLGRDLDEGKKAPAKLAEAKIEDLADRVDRLSTVDARKDGVTKSVTERGEQLLAGGRIDPSTGLHADKEVEKLRGDAESQEGIPSSEAGRVLQTKSDTWDLRAPANKLNEYRQLSEQLENQKRKEAELLLIYTKDATLVKENRASIDELTAQKKKIEAELPVAMFESGARGTKAPEEQLAKRAALEAVEKRLSQMRGDSNIEIVGRAIAKTNSFGFFDRFRDTSAKTVVAFKNLPSEPVAQTDTVRGAVDARGDGIIANEVELARSYDVAKQVVEKLDLTTAWAERYGGGQKLEPGKAAEILRKMVDVKTPDGKHLEISAQAGNSAESARIANATAETFIQAHLNLHRDLGEFDQYFKNKNAEEAQKLVQQQKALKEIKDLGDAEARPKPSASAPIPQPDVSVAANPFSTFSLNVSDVSFKLAAASLEKSVMPEAGSIRSEEFINAFDYRDPAAVSAPVAFAWERARYPFAHDRDLLRFSVKTAANGREAGKPLNLVLLLDASGSMERADRVRIIQECLRVLATQLQAQDKVSVVTFARTPRLWVDGLAGSAAGELVSRVGTVTPEGGTNLEEAMRVGYETAARHFATNGVNRLVLLTDGAANLGDVQPESLKKRVEENRKKGIALDCFGIGWEGLNDDLLEQLSRNGDGRYGFVNTPEAATTEFAQQLAGALKVAASDVKVQVEFNAKRATAYRQIGYAKHQLTKEQFRDNTVDAAEIGAAEAGNALYVVQVNPAGEGPIATVRVRFKIPGTNDYREHEWAVNYEGPTVPLEQSTATLRLAGAASAFSEWLSASPYAGEVTPDRLLGLMANIPEAFSNDSRPKQLEWMIRQAKSIAGK